jgi:hypothetical protein
MSETASKRPTVGRLHLAEAFDPQSGQPTHKLTNQR